MGAPPSEDDMARMLEDPNVQQMMNEALSNPQMVDMMLRSMPGMENNQQMRQMFNNPEFRRMMTNPEAIRQAAALRRMLGGGGGIGGQDAFPAPGVTDTTPGGATGGNPAQGTNQANPFGAFMMPPGFGAAGAGGANPFASLFAPPVGQTPVQTPPTGASTGTGTPAPNADADPNAPAANPFASLFGAAGRNLPAPGNITPEMIQETMRMMQNGQLGNMFGGANPFGVEGNAFGAASPPPPADTRPPEEIYASQLRQLNDMGFFDFDQNVAALRRSGGSVQGAIEQLLR
jgi:ubiquilin